MTGVQTCALPIWFPLPLGHVFFSLQHLWYASVMYSESFVTVYSMCVGSVKLAILGCSASREVKRRLYPGTLVRRGLRLGAGSYVLASSVKRILLWSEQDGSSDTCHPEIKPVAFSVASVRSMIVCPLAVTQVGSEP